MILLLQAYQLGVFVGRAILAAVLELVSRAVHMLMLLLALRTLWFGIDGSRGQDLEKIGVAIDQEDVIDVVQSRLFGLRAYGVCR